MPLIFLRKTLWAGIGPVFLVLLSQISSSSSPSGVNQSSVLELEVVLEEGAKSAPQSLVRWDEQKILNQIQIGKLQKVDRTDKVYVLGRGERVLQLSGVLVSQLLELAMAELPVEKKAEIDAIWIESADGRRAQIPRSFIIRYPLLFAISGVPKDLGDWMTVPPVNTHAGKMAQEELPFYRFTQAKVRRLILTNYRNRYSPYFLTRRKDPAALRGEKLVVQNCFACHGVGSGASPEILFQNGGLVRLQNLIESKHPMVEGLPTFTDRDRRALHNYLASLAMEKRL